MDGNLAYKLEPREELINGEVVLMAPARVNHGRVTRNISRIFDQYLTGKKCEYFPGGVGLFLEEGREEYEPDGMVVCDPEKVKDRGVVGAPDLVIEVLSPGTAKQDKGRKKDVYERHGVREYWIVDPSGLSIDQYVLEGGKFVLRDVYQKYPASWLSEMTEEERAKALRGVSCTLFDDLAVSLDAVFGRVVIER